MQDCDVLLSGDQNATDRTGVLAGVLRRVLHNTGSHAFRAAINGDHIEVRHFAGFPMDVWMEADLGDCDG